MRIFSNFSDARNLQESFKVRLYKIMHIVTVSLVIEVTAFDPVVRFRMEMELCFVVTTTNEFTIIGRDFIITEKPKKPRSYPQ